MRLSIGNWSVDTAPKGRTTQYGFVLGYKTLRAYPTFDKIWVYPWALFYAVKALKKSDSPSIRSEK